MDDFYTCHRDGPCTRQQLQGSESAAIVQRLESLMRDSREQRHSITYRDLVEVRYGSATPAATPFPFKCSRCGTQYTQAQACDWCVGGRAVAIEQTAEVAHHHV